MTILHSGASRKFANNWLKIFGGQKSPAKTARQGAASKASGAASTAKSTKQKAARVGKPASRKKSSAKKSGR